MATTATPVPPPAEETPPPAAKGKKKLIIIIAAAALVLLLGGGGAAFWLLGSKPHDATEESAEGNDPVAEDVVEAKPVIKKKKDDKKHAPVFLPLELFTVNLADREAERYAQVGITLELADTKVSDQLKAYMPAVRNDILMVLAHKKASDLQDRAGKLEFAREVRRAALKPLSEEEDSEPDDDSPVRAVHFSSFIIQ